MCERVAVPAPQSPVIVLSMSKLFLSPRNWPVWAFLVSAGMLGAAHAFEHIGRYLPCQLCLRQREVFWAAIAVALIGFVVTRLKPSERLLMTVNAMIGLIFLTSVVVAGYHAGVEWKLWPGPADCAAGGNLDLPGSLAEIDFSRRFATVSCSEAAWRLFGISMAGYNALLSLGLAAVSGFFALKTVSSASKPPEEFI